MPLKYANVEFKSVTKFVCIIYVPALRKPIVREAWPPAAYMYTYKYREYTHGTYIYMCNPVKYVDRSNKTKQNC